MRRLYQPLKFFFLLLSDYAAYATAMALAVYLRTAIPTLLPFLDFPQFYPYLYNGPEARVIPLLIATVFFFYSLYQKRFTFWEEALLIWKSLILAFLLTYVIMFNFAAVFDKASRVVLLLAFLGMMVTVLLFRWIIKSILFYTGFWRYPVLIACTKQDKASALRIVEAFKNDRFLGYVPKAFFIPDETASTLSAGGKDYPLCRSVDEACQQQTGTIFVVGAGLGSNQNLLSSLYGRFRRIFLVPPSLFGLMNSGVQYLFSERIFIISLENKINSLTARIIKDVWDYLGGFFILVACSPLLIITAIAVKISSPGPVFYRHERIGKGGKPFKIWKFRSMHMDADKKLAALLASSPELKKEWDTYYKLAKDPRITPIGNFLRKYSIDEFPQLFNVLSGEMSLIGPRPFVKGEMEELNPALVPLYTQLKPGLTGLWQVSGRNEADRLERMKIDVWYIQNWSPALDFLILLNTPKAVLTARGAR